MKSIEMNESFFAKFQSNINGLTTDTSKERLFEYGQNLIKGKKRKSYILMFVEEFRNILVLILIAATLFAFLSGETTDAIIISIVLILNATIGFFQKFKADKAIEALRKMIKPDARVLRDGEQIKIKAEEIVPGDILVLNEGDSIAADALLYETNELEAQESILTGESLPVKKEAVKSAEKFGYEAINIVFMGTMVTHGTARAIVLKTGMNTEMGKIAVLTTETVKDKSPLEKELDKIGIFVGKITLILSSILFVVGYFIYGREMIDTLIFATSVAVAAVPEGLPTTITIALAIGVQRLAKSNAIVKQLSSVETLGATTVICTDKTGTLTKNEMTVKEIVFDHFTAQVKGSGYEPFGTIHIDQKEKHIATVGNTKQPENEPELIDLETFEKNTKHAYESFSMFMLIAGLCNNAEIHSDESSYKVIGDPTEGALITLVQKSGINLGEVKKRYVKLHEFPFDSVRKKMTVIVEDKETSIIYALSKGAPSNMIKSCSHIMLSGRSIKLSSEDIKNADAASDKMAKKAYRCLALGYRELTNHEARVIKEKDAFPFEKKEIEEGMTFLGQLGMMDPPRPEVKEAIALTKKAGIRVYIITGDNGLTAEAISKQIGLIEAKSKYNIIQGHELDQMKENELKSLLSDKKRTIIFARVSPEHKLMIVSALKDLGEVIAVTGDGVNDAPALKKADIGVAMGISGTDVSKEAANMILSDDSFASIVVAIKEGRTIYENLKKFIYYMFSSNIGEVVLIFGAIILGLPAPLSAILILYINLTTDVFPAIALGVEPVEEGIMDKKPRNPQARILNRESIRRIIFSGSIIGIVTLIAFIWTLNRYGTAGLSHDIGYIKATSIAFLLMVTIELTNTLNARSEKQSIFKMNPFSNIPLIGSIIFSLLLTITILEIPYLQKHFDTTGMNLEDWIMVGIGSLTIIVCEEIRKYTVRRKERLTGYPLIATNDTK